MRISVPANSAASAQQSSWSAWRSPPPSFSLDAPARWERGTDHLLGEGVSGAANTLGNGFALTAGAATLWLAGRVGGHAGAEALGGTLTEGLLADGAVTLALKLATGRRRPDGSDRLSFPSGHTSGSFATATILGARFGPRMAWPAYGAATLVGLSRMEDRKHYFSDVVGGAALGILVGRVVTARAGLEWRAVPDAGGGPGLGVRFRF